MRNRCTNHLSKAKVRQSWSKYNLYNLSRIQQPSYRRATFFQQKWAAKSLARAYHGEQVREGQWEQMFSRRLRAVVPMNTSYLAKNDGSMESAGRGSGADISPQARRRSNPTLPTPYMQMTFAPLERRLDVAIFRALFASSTRQARQFVVHGAVKVNGKKMIYPSYLLNPGDMFQVEPDRVMFATGAPKDKNERKLEKASAAKPSESEEAIETSTEAEETPAEDSQPSEKSLQSSGNEDDHSPEAEEKEEEDDDDPRETLKSLLAQAKSILASPRDTIPAKRKQDLRAFRDSVRRVLSKSRSSTILTDSFEAQFLELKERLSRKRKRNYPPPSSSSSARSTNETKSSSTQDPDQDQDQQQPAQSQTSSPPLSSPESLTSAPFTKLSSSDLSALSDNDLHSLRAALLALHENPIDPSKPYATPWRPRDYMSAFAFIPRYLEVNQNICAAVYLRHPVARPGLGEVPTPFGESVGGAAFGWYLRRR